MRGVQGGCHFQNISIILIEKRLRTISGSGCGGENNQRTQKKTEFAGNRSIDSQRFLARRNLFEETQEFAWGKIFGKEKRGPLRGRRKIELRKKTKPVIKPPGDARSRTAEIKKGLPRTAGTKVSGGRVTKRSILTNAS